MKMRKRRPIRLSYWRRGRKEHPSRYINVRQWKDNRLRRLCVTVSRTHTSSLARAGDEPLPGRCPFEDAAVVL